MVDGTDNKEAHNCLKTLLVAHPLLGIGVLIGEAIEVEEESDMKPEGREEAETSKGVGEANQVGYIVCFANAVELNQRKKSKLSQMQWS